MANAACFTGGGRGDLTASRLLCDVLPHRSRWREELSDPELIKWEEFIGKTQGPTFSGGQFCYCRDAPA